jgi:DNA-binding NarL/FixJ family response regulator
MRLSDQVTDNTRDSQTSPIRRPAKRDPEEEKIASLTARELEVIACLSEGRRNKQIGERLFISEKTVRDYFTSIFDKLGVSDRLELIIYAYKHGLTKIPATSSMEQAKAALVQSFHLP